MKRMTLPLLAAVMLAVSAPVAMAQVTTTQKYGPSGYSSSRAVHRGNMTVTRSMSRGPLGFHGCNTITRSVRTPFGVRRSSIHRCH